MAIALPNGDSAVAWAGFVLQLFPFRLPGPEQVDEIVMLSIAGEHKTGMYVIVMTWGASPGQVALCIPSFGEAPLALLARAVARYRDGAPAYEPVTAPQADSVRS